MSREQRLREAELEAYRRYAAFLDGGPRTALEKLAFIWGPDGAGLILGVEPDPSRRDRLARLVRKVVGR